MVGTISLSRATGPAATRPLITRRRMATLLNRRLGVATTTAAAAADILYKATPARLRHTMEVKVMGAAMATEGTPAWGG